MVKKTITFTNFDGEVVSKTCYFNISKAEALDLEMASAGGFAEKINEAVNSRDKTAMYVMFKDLILMSYGERAADGNGFIKSEALTTEFKQSLAYDELMMELCTNIDSATAFFNGIIPKIDLPVPAPANV